jgi:Domain of unknown function (DU1801)
VDPESYIDALPEGRREDVRRLDALIRETLPQAKRHASGGMLGYGPYRYRYASGREGDAYLVALASRKAGISLYVSCVADDAYLPQRYAARLGKVDVGKSCIRLRRVEDLDLDALRELLVEAGRVGGAAAV